MLDSPCTSDDLFFLLPIAEATNDGPWTSYGASCSICSSADSMIPLDIRFFIEVKLLFEYLLYFGFGVVPGFCFFLSNAVYSNITPSTLVLQIFDLISVLIEGTAHLFNLFFDLMQSGLAWFQVLDIFLGELKAHLQVASVFLVNI